MFNKISIIGCGLIGSSIMRGVEEKKLASKISAYDKSSKVTDYINLGDQIEVKYLGIDKRTRKQKISRKVLLEKK